MKKQEMKRSFVAGCPSFCQPAGITRWTSSFLELLRLLIREGASLPSLYIGSPTPLR